MNKLFVFVFLALIATIHCIGTSCGGNGQDIRITGCTKEPCILKKGSQGTIEIDFKPSEDSKTLTGSIVIKMGRGKVSWPGYNRNACKNSNIECPLTASSQQTYKYNYKILNHYPKILTTATIQLVNEKKKVEACYNVKVKIE